MKYLSKYILLAAIIIAAGYPAKAQENLELSIGYNVGVPTSSFNKDYITKPSYRGFVASLDYALNSKWRVGLGLGFNDYYQKYPRQVYTQKDGTSISAILSNSIQQFPVIGHVNYTILEKGFIRPYVGTGAGANFISFDQYLGEFDNPVSKVKPIVQVEAGIFIPLSRYSSTAVKLGGTFNYAPFNEYGSGNLDTWSIQAGIRFPLK
jgi:hypothetical protein